MHKLLIAAALALSLSACGDTEKSAETATSVVTAPKKIVDPATQINQMVKALRNNDVLAFMQNNVPAKDFADMQKEYEASRKRPMTDAERQKMDENLAQFWADDAVDSMMQRVEPMLQQYGPNIGNLINMGTTYALGQIQLAQDFNATQKQQLTALLTSASTWAKGIDFTDRARLRTALTAVRDAVVASKIKTADDLRALNFQQAMDKMQYSLQAVKGALAAYDLNLDQTLDSMKAQMVSQEGDTATVRLDYTVFGTPMTMETNMVQQDGRWISSEANKAIQAEMMAEASE